MARVTRSRKRQEPQESEHEGDSDNGIEEQADADLPQVQDASMSALERARLENIARNERMLSDLGIVGVRASLAGSAKPVVKKATARVMKPKVEVAPTRRSSRVTSDKLQAEIKRLKEEGNVQEAEKKQVELDEMIGRQLQGSYVVESAPAEDAYQRLPPEPLSLHSALLNVEDSDDESARTDMVASLSAALKSATDSMPEKIAGGRKRTKTESRPSTSFSPLRLTGECVAKLTASRATSVALHPSSSKVIAAAGDKVGNVGLWDVDCNDEGGSVFRYRPHVSNVMRLHFPDVDPSKLHSFSYDGTLRLLDIEAQAWLLAFEEPEDLREVYLTDAWWLADHAGDGTNAGGSSGHSVLVSKSDGQVGFVDLRAAPTYQWQAVAHESKVQSVQQHPVETNLVLTSSSRTGISIHDMRMTGRKQWPVVQNLDLHSKSINAAYISPDGRFVVSVAQDGTVKATADFLSKSYQTTTLRHDNFTGRWLSTFRPTFDPKRPATFVLGSMLQPRRVEIFAVNQADKSAPRIELVQNLASEWLASVCSRNCFHSSVEAVLGSNSSGKVHLFR